MCFENVVCRIRCLAAGAVAATRDVQAQASGARTNTEDT